MQCEKTCDGRQSSSDGLHACRGEKKQKNRQSPELSLTGFQRVVVPLFFQISEFSSTFTDKPKVESVLRTSLIYSAFPKKTWVLLGYYY